MRFRKFTFSFASPLLGVHVGRNPANGQRFMHVAPLPFFGLDYELKPYGQPPPDDDGTERVDRPLLKASAFYFLVMLVIAIVQDARGW